MFIRNIEDITMEDMQYLIYNEIGEDKTLEYKRELQIDTGDDRKEFLADVSAFANAEGGMIIFGVEENDETNTPQSVCGIIIDNEDELVRKIDNLTRDSISPRIPEIKYKIIALSDANKSILIIQIGQSYILPHRVTYKGWDKFFVRDSKGKHPMDIDELRQSFGLSDSLFKKIEDYKMDRISFYHENKYGIFDSKSLFY